MALVKYGGGVVQLSGRIAGNVFARNAGGNYVRAGTIPVNPNSTDQVTVRAVMAQLMVRWAQTLTAAQRTAWETYAQAVTVLNRLGEAIHISGVNHYVRSNSLLLRSGDTIVDAGPTVLALPDQDPAFAITASVGAGNVSCAFDAGLNWANIDDGHMHVFMGRPQNATRNFFNGPWRYADTFDGNTAVPLTTPQTFVPPFTLVEGQKIWVRARIQEPDGRVSNLFRDDVVVVA